MRHQRSHDQFRSEAKAEEAPSDHRKKYDQEDDPKREAKPRRIQESQAVTEQNDVGAGPDPTAIGFIPARSA